MASDAHFFNSSAPQRWQSVHSLPFHQSASEKCRPGHRPLAQGLWLYDLGIWVPSNFLNDNPALFIWLSSQKSLWSVFYKLNILEGGLKNVATDVCYHEESVRSLIMKLLLLLPILNDCDATLGTIQDQLLVSHHKLSIPHVQIRRLRLSFESLFKLLKPTLVNRTIIQSLILLWFAGSKSGFSQSHKLCGIQVGHLL